MTGRGVRVGVISDSYDCVREPFEPGAPFSTAEQDRYSDDVPQDVIVLNEYPACSGGTDEGRAMMQVVHDVAPGANGAFATAWGTGTASFANKILALQEQAGAQVIVDDIYVLSDPMFADGIIAQAIDEVAKRGVAYFSAAGNFGRASYESAYRETDEVGPTGRRHDFDPGPGVDTLQSWTLPSGTFDLLVFQWDAPYLTAGARNGSDSDLDIYFYDAAGHPLPSCSDPAADPCQFAGTSYDIGSDPVEFGYVSNYTGEPVLVQVSIERYVGPGDGPGVPTRVKWVQVPQGEGEGTPLEYDTRSSTLYGHANAASAIAVGGAFWADTKEWGSLRFGAACGYGCLTSYSSAGGTPVLFGNDGRRLRRPEYRAQPAVTAAHGGNTTFGYFDLEEAVGDEPDGWPNFFGTSAAAPHVAGIAALMIEASGKRLRPRTIREILGRTAADLTVRRVPGGFVALGRGFDYDSGYGFVDARRAVCAAARLGPYQADGWVRRCGG